jgi:hypothetical protein
MPDGLEVTIPPPDPEWVTVSRYRLAVNVAVTVVAAVIVTVHEPVPLHPPPDQPAKYEPVLGEADRRTAAPWS